MTELIRDLNPALWFAPDACFQDSSLASSPWATLASSGIFGPWETGSGASLLLPSPLVATETWSSAELRGRPGAALGEERHQSIASPHLASRTIPASSALDYQVPAKAPKVSSVPFFSTRWWQAARHFRSLKIALLKIGKARSSPLMPRSYSAELSTLLCWKAPVDHGNNPANHFIWYDLENLVLFVAWLSLQINAARLIKCSQLTVQAIN